MFDRRILPNLFPTYFLPGVPFTKSSRLNIHSKRKDGIYWNSTGFQSGGLSGLTGGSSLRTTNKFSGGQHNFVDRRNLKEWES